MHKLSLILFYLLLWGKPSEGQVVKIPSGDLQGAQKIAVNNSYVFPQSPVGFGNIKEFAINTRRNPIIFKEERNTIWFQIDIPFDGALTFNIQPHSIFDDYDWMLYNYDPELKNALQNETARPLRSNNARNDKKINSQTGIKEGFLNQYELLGPGDSYSSPLTVKKGDKLALVIDNIYDGGLGFNLSLELKPVLNGIITGVVKSKKTGRRLQAEIVLEDDSTGVFISKTTSDPLTGEYSLKVPLNWPVNITASNVHYLFSTEDIVLDKSQTGTADFLLDTVQAGNKLIFYNIHFKANKDEILSSSDPDLDRLTTFLKEKPEWVVKIVGHTNNNVFAEPRYLQKLSFDRAIAVKNYLIKNGISEKRLSCTGQGGKVPIITTKDPVLGMKNLRVEVVLMGK